MNESSRQLFWNSNSNPILKQTPIVWFDGINNVGAIHSDSTNVWANLAQTGAELNAIRNTNSQTTASLWTSNGALFTNRTDRTQPFFVGGSWSRKAFQLIEDSYTVAATFTPLAGWKTNYSGVIGSHSSWGDGTNIGFQLCQYENGTCRSGVRWLSDRTSLTDVAFDASRLVNGEVVNMMFTVSTSKRAMYHNGQLVGEVNAELALSNIHPTGNPLTIGSCFINESTTSTDRTFVGTIFDMYMLPRAVDAEEAEALAAFSLERFKL